MLFMHLLLDSFLSHILFQFLTFLSWFPVDTLYEIHKLFWWKSGELVDKPKSTYLPYDTGDVQMCS